MTCKFIYMFCLVILLPVLLIGQQDVSVSAAFNQGTLYENQQATFTVVVQTANPNGVPQPQLPDFSDWFRLAGSTGRSTSISIVNGRTSASVTFSFVLIPVKVGLAKLAPVELSVGGKTFKSDAISVEIKDSSAMPATQPQTQSRGGQQQQTGPIDLFVLAIPEKKIVYQNEGITLDYKVYIGNGISVREYSIQTLPNTAGFWAEDYPLGQAQPVSEVYKSKRYQTAVLKRLELFPTNSGEYDLDMMEFEFSVTSTGGRRSAFDSFFNDPFFNRTQPVRVNSNAPHITVLPLPEAGKPAGFKGVVGTYGVAATVDKQSVKANESITLKVTYSGAGNIKFLPDPELNIRGVHQMYDPQINENIGRTGSQITGSKEYEYVIIPRKEGELRISPVALAYFDPKAKLYKTVSSKPITVKVLPGDEVITGSPRNLTRDEVRLVGADIRFIKESVNKWQRVGDGQIAFTFWFFMFLPVAMIGGAFVLRKHREKLDSDVGYRRNRKAGSVAVKRLKAASAALSVGNSVEFYPAVTKALQDYIADKLNVASAGIVTHELEAKLKERNLDQEAAEKYINCLQQCDFHQFSSAAASEEDMKTLLSEAESVISLVEERMKK